MAQQVNALHEYVHDVAVGGSKPDVRKWEEVVGRRVQAEGIAWGSFEKGFGEYVIVNRAAIYVPKSGFLDKEADGRLVKVSGILRARKISATRGTDSGPAQDTVIYELDEAKWEFIEKVKWPWLQEVQ